MKRLLAMTLVLGLTSSVLGTAVEFRIDGALTTEVTLQGSETAAIEVWATGLTNGFSIAYMGLSTMPPLVEGFTFDAAIPGPNMYGHMYLPREPGPGTNIHMNDLGRAHR